MQSFLDKPIQSEDQFTNWKAGVDGVLLQKTGFIDFNGQKIFEGDILQEVRTGLKFFVKFSHILKEFVFSNNPDNKTSLENIAYRLGENLIIIGNIYENPELLKE